MAIKTKLTEILILAPHQFGQGKPEVAREGFKDGVVAVRHGPRMRLSASWEDAVRPGRGVVEVWASV